MLTKYLFGKPTRLWDLHLDQALFACRVRTQSTTNTSPYYLVYGQHPRLVGDDNFPLDTSAPPEDYVSRLQLVQSARQEAARLTYEKALRAKEARDEIVQPHNLDIGDWVLVRHENPQKFESKWFGPYQVVEKMMLGTYRLQDPNGKELLSLVHGNRLLKARISSAEELRTLWAAPATKDQLRRLNLCPDLITSDVPGNTDLLERYLADDDDFQEANASTLSLTDEISTNLRPDSDTAPQEPPPNRPPDWHSFQSV